MSLGPQEEDYPSTSGPSATRSLLWESVLRRSLLSGDADRLEAAISLAETGGASREVLTDARKKLCSIVLASLTRARQASDAAALLAAIDRADELRLEGAEVGEARQELRRLAHSRLEGASPGSDAEELESALRLASMAGSPNAALFARAQRRLRELREPAARAGGHCVLDVGVAACGVEDDDCHNVGPASASLVGLWPGKLHGNWDQASLAPPTLIGRQTLGDDILLEAGLRKQHQSRVVPSGAQLHVGRGQKAGGCEVNTQECSVQ